MFFEIQRCLFLWNFHTKCSLFSTDFQTFDKNVNLSKTNPEAENFFLAFPSLKYLDFYDVSKNSEHINTFLRGPTQKSPFQIPKFNFLEQKES